MNKAIRRTLDSTLSSDLDLFLISWYHRNIGRVLQIWINSESTTIENILSNMFLGEDSAEFYYRFYVEESDTTPYMQEDIEAYAIEYFLSYFHKDLQK